MLIEHQMVTNLGRFDMLYVASREANSAQKYVRSWYYTHMHPYIYIYMQKYILVDHESSGK